MQELKQIAVRESRTLTEIVSETLVRGLSYRNAGICAPAPWACVSYNMGGGLDYSKAWDRLNELELSAVAEKLELRK